jgi:hypothetical protein
MTPKEQSCSSMVIASISAASMTRLTAKSLAGVIEVLPSRHFGAANGRHRLRLFFAIRTPMPPSSSSSVNKIPACSKAAWIRTNVEM